MFGKLKNFLKSKKQKGQSLIFVGITIPILFAFVGLAVDSGWTYLNQTTLQGAADAAAFAGANKSIQDEKSLSDYGYATIVATTNSNFQKLVSNKTIESRVTEEEDNDAKRYALLALNESVSAQLNVNHELTEETSTETGKVKFERILFGPDTDDYNALYYTVQLTEKLDHVFPILDFLGIGTNNIVAVSTVKVSHVPTYDDPEKGDTAHGLTLYQQMKAKEQNETYSNWENIVVAKNGSSTLANDRSVLTGGAYYGSGNINRVEMSTLDGNGFASSNGNPYVKSISSEGSNYSGQYGFDDLFIDFQGEIRNVASGGDVDMNISKVNGWNYGDTLTGNAQYAYRVHMPICINTPYPVRTLDGKRPPDSLYAFIEQEPIIRTVTKSNGELYYRSNMSAVRQLVISNNVSNYDSSSQRPWIFFYEGPEIATYAENSSVYDSEKKTYIGARPFLPVILNLNADFRGVVFAPNNPMVINGNGFKMQGFVVAKSFKQLADEEYFKSNDYVKVSFNNNSDTYVNENGIQELPSTLVNYTMTNLVKPSGYTEVDINTGVKNSAGNEIWVKGYVVTNQWYTRSQNPDTKQYAEIRVSGNRGRYSYFNQLKIPVVTYNGKKYGLKTYDSTLSSSFDLFNKLRLYSAITTESVTYTGSTTSRTITSNGKTIYLSSGKTITQTINKMYISNTAYTYEKEYTNTNGVEKTKTAYVSIGDVLFTNVSSSERPKNEDGTYTETPDDTSETFDDDATAYYDPSVFNLSSASHYNSFYNVSLVNYTYLAKSESGSGTSKDMFFTTERAKHID